MSGNVGEFVSTFYSSRYPYIYGGGYCSNVSYIEKTSNVSTYSYSYRETGFYFGAIYDYTENDCRAKGVGFRLLLTCK